VENLPKKGHEFFGNQYVKAARAFVAKKRAGLAGRVKKRKARQAADQKLAMNLSHRVDAIHRGTGSRKSKAAKMKRAQASLKRAHARRKR